MLNYFFEFPEGLRRIGHLNFYESKIKKVILPSTLEELGSGLFISSELEEIKLPSGLRFIPDQIFARCSKLKKVEWPEEVEAIGAYAFMNTPLMTEVEIPQTVKLIGASAFANHYSPYERVVLPEGSEQAYRNAEVWKEFKNIATPTSLKSAIVDTKDSERIYDLRGVEQNREKGLVIKNGIKIINN